jgi:type IV pilus assembly protein PilP
MIRHQLKNSSRNLAVIALIGSMATLSGCKEKPQPAPAPVPAAAPAAVPAAAPAAAPVAAPAAAPVAAPVAAPAAANQVAKPVQKPVSSSVKLAPPPAGNQFDFSNKKDPFKPFVAVKMPAKQTPEDVKKALISGLPIHSFDVSQFRLIGIVTGAKENQAMVVDPGGKGYVLKVGMTIGKNEGKVTTITTTGVDVVEQFKDDNGRVRKEVIKITLPRKQ